MSKQNGSKSVNHKAPTPVEGWRARAPIYWGDQDFYAIATSEAQGLRLELNISGLLPLLPIRKRIHDHVAKYAKRPGSMLTVLPPIQEMIVAAHETFLKAATARLKKDPRGCLYSDEARGWIADDSVVAIRELTLGGTPNGCFRDDLMRGENHRPDSSWMDFLNPPEEGALGEIWIKSIVGYKDEPGHVDHFWPLAALRWKLEKGSAGLIDRLLEKSKRNRGNRHSDNCPIQSLLGSISCREIEGTAREGWERAFDGVDLYKGGRLKGIPSGSKLFEMQAAKRETVPEWKAERACDVLLLAQENGFRLEKAKKQRLF